MDFNDIHGILERNLETHLNQLIPCDSQFLEILKYGVLPAGKLFRPKICAAAFADLNELEALFKELKDPSSPLSLCASSLEIHHAYTLIHDDLPCMDDDDMRRGRPSTHKKYGQWQAVLAGDALLHFSHTLLSKIHHIKAHKLTSFFNWALGAKGLILGQVFDLNGSINKSFENLLRTHTLKTGRLIQTSLYLGQWCAQPNLGFKELKNNLRFGEALGLSFQLLDDLSEGAEPINDHEKSVNPFINFPEESLKTLCKSLETITKEVSAENNHYLQLSLKQYFSKMKGIIEKDLESDNSLIFKHFNVLEDNQKEQYQFIVNLLN
jgi:geranylgeranyl pyrophosphate synthase